MAHQAKKVSDTKVSYTIAQSDPPRRPCRPVLTLEIPRAKFDAIQSEMSANSRSVSARAGFLLLSGHFQLVPV